MMRARLLIQFSYACLSQTRWRRAMSTPQAKAIGIIGASLVLISSGIGLSLGNPLKTQGEEAKTDKVKELLKEKLSILQGIASQKIKAYEQARITFTQVHEA